MTNPKKTQAELEEIIKQEALTHPYGDGIFSVGLLLEGDSWRVCSVGRNNEVVKLDFVERIANEVRSRYDLAA